LMVAVVAVQVPGRLVQSHTRAAVGALGEPAAVVALKGWGVTAPIEKD